MLTTIGSLKRLSTYIGGQLASAVSITGGTINGAAIGGTTPAAGAFTTLASSGTYTATGLISQSNTTTATALSNTYGVVGAMTASATDIVSGNLRGVRGQVTLSGTVTGGAYVMGGQNKLIVSGTMNHADCRFAASLAQLDISAGTYTAGQLSALWVDAGATASTSAIATKGGGQFNLLRLTNTTAALSNSLIYGYADADFLFDLDGPGGNADWYSSTGSVTADDGWLKVKVGGNTRYIGLGATVG